MTRLAGQAGRVLRWVMQSVLTLVLVASCLVAVLAWRLSRGPLELAWLTHQVEAAVNQGGKTHVAIGGLSVAWSGFRDGADAPLELRLSDVAATDPSGASLAAVAQVDVALAVAPLLTARIAPRLIEVTGARIKATRAADGRFTLEMGDLDQAATPATGSGDLNARLSEMRQMRVRDAAVSVVDRGMGVTWELPVLQVDLRRRDQGGIEGQARATLALGGQSIAFELDAAGVPGGASAADFRVSGFNPAQIASLAPAFAPLAALDAPVTLAGRADLGPDLMPLHLAANVEIGAGTAHIADGVSPLLAASLVLDATPERLDATLRRLVLSAKPEAAKTTIWAHLLGTRKNGRIAGDLTVDIDQAAFADLAALWPAGVGGPGTRPWITRNITSGFARNAHAAVTLAAPEDFSDVAVTSIAVGIDGRDLTVHWLRPVPPAEHVDGHMSMTKIDDIEISVAGGHQVGGAVKLRGGRVHLSGIAGRDQFADIETDIAGPLADVVALLKNPRLRLLDKSPVPLRDVAGQLAGHLSFVHLPLKDSVALDDIQIKTRAHVTGAHLGGVVAGKNLDRGTLDLEAGNDGMSVKGDATVAGVPAQMRFDMDFRKGPPSQVLERITATATLDERILDSLGLKTAGMLTGKVPVRAEAAFQRGGRGDVSVHADLSAAALRAEAIDWRKEAGPTASADARLVLDHDRIVQVNQMRAIGPGVDIQGGATFAGGQPNVLLVDVFRLGETDVRGEIRLPAKPGDAYEVKLAGPSLDASGFFGDGTKPAKPKPKDNSPGPAYAVDARIGRVLMAGRAEVTGLVARVENDGRIVRQAHVEGSLGRAPFQVDVTPAGRGRHLDARTADAGALLRVVGVLKELAGGRLAVVGDWDDRSAGHPLSATLELDEFRIRDAPVIGKILQAMTLYGLVDALTTGPGLNFTRAVVPFRLAGGVLEVAEARAFSASLGMTAKGSIDLDRRLANVQGTVVPAYFFNTALGNLPLIGRLFSPEKGGGVFAATYSVSGLLDNPSVGVNPLAVLTPGFLRGLFDGFQNELPAPVNGGAGGGGNR